ncbi:hypothetical protein SGL43_05552 [Streptomyces globisporus]|uniref:Uncharacterized protein n=1 Tax=Streptomyces globisporus TaxID=1908 RepID=A0ABM9H4G5_STRGL|nr:hypothetical protein SGL43_05552 [Streptomyces globisporus]
MGPYVHDRDGGGRGGLSGAGEQKCSEGEGCDHAGDKSRAHEGSCGGRGRTGTSPCEDGRVGPSGRAVR